MLRAVGRGLVRQRVSGVGVLFALLVLAIAPGRAQTLAPPPAQAVQPVTGFVPPYEIMRTVRASGFDPLAPPLREGTDYVLRATDFRGILMRVVVDARTAAIRDVTRIVPGPGRYGEFYGAPPYGRPLYGSPPYGAAELDVPPVPYEASIAPPPVHPPALRPIPNPAAALPLPLPRPRPAALASRKPDDAGSAAKPQPMPDTRTGTNTGTGAAIVAKPAGAPDAKPQSDKTQSDKTQNAKTQNDKTQINSEVITTTPPPAPAGAKRAPIAVEPLND
jgi:hypothetical protein